MSDFGPNRFEAGGPMLLAGLRRRHRFTDAENSLAHQWRDFASAGEIPGRVGGERFGVMCGADSSGFEYMCGVEVESFAGLPPTMGRMRVPAQHYAVFVHDAHRSTLRATWQRILEWLAHGDYASAHLPDFERYPPEAEPPRPIEGVEIWVGVVPRAGRDGVGDGSG